MWKRAQKLVDNVVDFSALTQKDALMAKAEALTRKGHKEAQHQLVCAAAAGFDRKATTLSSRARKLLVEMNEDPTFSSMRTPARFQMAVFDVATHRFNAPYVREQVKTYKSKGPKMVIKQIEAFDPCVHLPCSC